MYEFCSLVHSFFPYCFPYSYRSSNYCDSNSCRSLTLLKALAKSNGNLFAIAFKSERERRLSLNNEWLDGTINISYFGGSNNIFADCTRRDYYFDLIYLSYLRISMKRSIMPNWYMRPLNKEISFKLIN